MDLSSAFTVRSCLTRWFAYLEELIYCLGDPHAGFNSRERKIDIRRWVGRRLHRLRLPLLAHLGRLLAILLVESFPFLDPVVGRSGGLDDEISRNIFLVARSQKLKELKLLFVVK